MIEKLSYWIARSIKRMNPEETASIDVMRFSITIFLNLLVTIGFISLVSIILGTFQEVMICMLAFMTFRFFTGGIHLKTAELCIIVSGLLIIFTPFIGHYVRTEILTYINLILTFIFAPSNLDQTIRVDKSLHIVYKIIATCLCIVAIMLNNHLITVAMFVQCLLFIPYNKLRR